MLRQAVPIHEGDAYRGAHIHIAGIVQGVGFRPFVYGLAQRLSINGRVCNTSAGVEIDVEGQPDQLQAFIAALRNEAPPLASIDRVEVSSQPVQGFSSFHIDHSEDLPGAFQPVSPDVCICPDCLHELFDPRDRRYRYPFINCTNCGPRFTIITGLPYDRPKTTMAGFALCADCTAEYQDPLDRRFHAQPVACPNCGPQIWFEWRERLETGAGENRPAAVPNGEATLLLAQQSLADGRILAIKGLGGFHLACNAEDDRAVAELRARKLRIDKPFALMMADLETVERHCFLSAAERELLESRSRPIVILKRRPETSISQQVAPGQDTLGVMLPYTPMHYLLFAPLPQAGDDFHPASALVMTSANLSEEPIAFTNEDARSRLSNLADGYLMHDRPIRTRCDDSVVRLALLPGEPQETLLPLRRSRGYAPFPVHLPWRTLPLLAGGGELKNTFCLVRDEFAFLSHHIGDLENYDTLLSFTDGVRHFERLFRVEPQAYACDLHPDYMATRYILERAAREHRPVISVQHHHAHIASVMAENGLDASEPVIGVALDGTGYGTDGTIWGGEFLLAGYREFHRAAHLAPIPLPGGDKAVRHPWRLGLAWLSRLGLDSDQELPPVQYTAGQVSPLGLAEADVVRRQIHSGLNAPLTSSMGRLFDAAASLAGLRQSVSYEAQAAIEWEALADPQEPGVYPFDILAAKPGEPLQIDPLPAFSALIADQRRGLSIPVLSARFHNGVAQMILAVCRQIRTDSGLKRVALSGGVWQNLTLLNASVRLLRQAGFTVYLHRKVPANDGGLALGQAAVALHTLVNQE